MTNSTPPKSLKEITERQRLANDRLEATLNKSPFPHARKLVYVAGRFTAIDRAGVEQNIAAAVTVGLEVAKLGACPIIPHANTAHPDFEHIQPCQFWIESTMAMLDCCDALITVPGWEASKGARGEVAAALRDGKPCFHSPAELAAWLGVEVEP